MVATSPSMRSHSWSEVNSVVMEFPLAFVGILDERRGGDLERQALAAPFREHGGADDCNRRWQVAHCDRRIEARAKAARCDLADRLARRRIRKQARALA